MLKSIFSICITALLHLGIIHSMETPGSIDKLLKENADLHSIIAHNNFILPEPVMYSEPTISTVLTNNDNKKKRSASPTTKLTVKKKKSKKNDESKKKTKKKYQIPCALKGCTKTSFIARRKSDLISQILIHKYSEKHSPETYEKITTYYNNNTKQDTLTLKYNVKCTLCEKIFTSTRKRSLIASLLHHLYATSLHNDKEYKETKLTVENYFHSVTNQK